MQNLRWVGFLRSSLQWLFGWGLVCCVWACGGLQYTPDEAGSEGVQEPVIERQESIVDAGGEPRVQEPSQREPGSQEPPEGEGAQQEPTQQEPGVDPDASERTEQERRVEPLLSDAGEGPVGEMDAGAVEVLREPVQEPVPERKVENQPEKVPESGQATGSWPTANACSWDGSWMPTTSPFAGLLDDEYFDGHTGRDGKATPILPPGKWDWNDANNDLANWRNFASNLGTFQKVVGSNRKHCGWKLIGKSKDVDYAGPASYFEGSSGADLLHLGALGKIHSFRGNLGDGPDVLVFQKSWALDFRTGSSKTGGARDNDLVVAGCGPNPAGDFDVLTTTIHTGPGSDWVFVRDISRAAIDLGNGNDGDTSVLDPLDKNDLVVLRGNTHDFRVMGGRGDDVAVWYLDDNVQKTTWLGPNFFGGGSHLSALWDDPGTDRLVLAVPSTTKLVTQTPTPKGALLVRGTTGKFVRDDPTWSDPYARYCVECGTSPTGRKTMILEYRSADGKVFTGYFYVTAFEELQIGVGAQARVYKLDDINGKATLDPQARPFTPPKWPDWYCK